MSVKTYFYYTVSTVSMLVVLFAFILAACAPSASNPSPPLKGVPGVTIEFRQLIDRDDNVRAYRIEDTEKGVVCYIPAVPFASGQPAISCVKK